jgi:hypothetical protein
MSRPVIALLFPSPRYDDTIRDAEYDNDLLLALLCLTPEL